LHHHEHVRSCHLCGHHASSASDLSPGGCCTWAAGKGAHPSSAPACRLLQVAPQRTAAFVARAQVAADQTTMHPQLARRVHLRHGKIVSWMMQLLTQAKAGSEHESDDRGVFRSAHARHGGGTHDSVTWASCMSVSSHRSSCLATNRDLGADTKSP